MAGGLVQADVVRPIQTISVLALLSGLLPGAARAEQTMGTLRLDAGGGGGALVLIDNERVGATPLPGPWTLAPGSHTVEVRVAGSAPEKRTFEVRAGDVTVVKIAMKAAAAPPPEVEPPPPPPRIVHRGAGFSLATAGYVSAGVGLAALGAGIFFGLDASGKSDDARALDRSDPGTSRGDLNALAADADRSAFFSNLSFGVAGVGLAAGAAMLLLARDGPFGSHPATVVPIAGGAGIGGRF